jgi:hypothetical protein
MRELFYLGISHSLLLLIIIPDVGLCIPFSLTLYPPRPYNHNLQNKEAEFFLAAILFFIPNKITDKTKNIQDHVRKRRDNEVNAMIKTYGGFFTHLIFLKNTPEVPPEVTMKLEYSGHYPISLITSTDNDFMSRNSLFILRKKKSLKTKSACFYIPEKITNNPELVDFNGLGDASPEAQFFTISSNNFNKLEKYHSPTRCYGNDSDDLYFFRKEPGEGTNCLDLPDDKEMPNSTNKPQQTNIEQINLARERLHKYCIPNCEQPNDRKKHEKDLTKSFLFKQKPFKKQNPRLTEWLGVRQTGQTGILSYKDIPP